MGVENTSAIIRLTYAFGGQAVATRIINGSSTLYYIHNDHLGSNSRMSTSAGSAVANSTARYTPFGDWRTEPTATLTDRGYTGHLHNNLGSGSDDLGLIYMNARYYLPGIARFASADTIVSSPANPQSFNKYSYVENRPLNFMDPSGYCKSTGTVDSNGSSLYACMDDDGNLYDVTIWDPLYSMWLSRMESLWGNLSSQATGSFADFVGWALDGGLFFHQTSAADLAWASGGNHLMGFSPLFLYDGNGNPQFTAYRDDQIIYHLWSIGLTDVWGSDPGQSLLIPLSGLSTGQTNTLYNFMYNAIAMDAVMGNSGVRLWTKDVSSSLQSLGSLADKWSIKSSVELAVSIASMIPQYVSNAQEGFQRTYIANVQFNNPTDGLASSGFNMSYSVAWVWQGFSPYANTAH